MLQGNANLKPKGTTSQTSYTLAIVYLDDLKKRMNWFHQDDLKEKAEFILFFKIVLVQNS